MKLLVASDIHGSTYYCRLLLERLREEQPDKMLLLGDLLYHGARNPLPREYSTLKTAELLNGVKDKLLCVKGNCDSEVDSMVLEFPVEAEFALLSLFGRRTIATHGHKSPVRLGEGDVLLNGHFHVPAFEEREGYFYVNCGSVSIPKENSPHSYLVADDEGFTWKDAETGKIFRRETIR